ncbi:hypothetical protein V6N13_038813 [Hibiscus sabdariffa]
MSVFGSGDSLNGSFISERSISRLLFAEGVFYLGVIQAYELGGGFQLSLVSCLQFCSKLLSFILDPATKIVSNLEDFWWWEDPVKALNAPSSFSFSAQSNLIGPRDGGKHFVT